MKKIFAAIFFVLALFFTSGDASAQYGCPPYGAECPASSAIVVDKTIRDPRSKGENYVDNLTYSDYRFGPGEDVVFKITVKNTGNKAIDNVTAIDTLPEVTDNLLLSGETNSSIRTIEKSFGTLAAGESRTWYFRIRVKPASELPNGITCADPKAINRVVVRSKDMPDTSDTSSFCTEKKVLGVTSQPKTGSELYIVLSALLSISGLGFIGSKMAQKASL